MDANVLIDLGVEDATRARLAARALESCAAAGQLVICDIVLAELTRGFPEGDEPFVWIEELGILYDPIGAEAAERAGRIHARYESRTTRTVRRPIADFLVGAHAVCQSDRLLTRDRGFYRDYFQGLDLMEPSE